MPLVDEPNTDLEEKAQANMTTIRLYDPAVDGKTPADGEGKPATSQVILRDIASKLEDGFTTTVVGWEGTWPVIGNAPVYPGVPWSPQAAVAEDEPVKITKPRGTVMRSTSRTRTIKR